MLNNIVREKKNSRLQRDCLEPELLFLLEVFFLSFGTYCNMHCMLEVAVHWSCALMVNISMQYSGKKKPARWNMISSPPSLELSVFFFFFLREVWVFLDVFVVVSFTPVSRSISPPVILVWYPIPPLEASRLHVGWYRNSAGICPLCRGGVASLLPAWPQTDNSSSFLLLPRV